jgi:signal transduction histidine kinase
MGMPAKGLLGKTLNRNEGFPQLSRYSIGYTVRRATQSAIAVAAFVLGMTATSAAIEGYAIAGVETELPGGHVLAVSPTGFAWRDGIRPGQEVVALDDTYSAGGWRLDTVDGLGRHESRELPVEDALRSSLALAVGALLAGALAVVSIRMHRGWVEPLAAVGLWLATVPLWLEGEPVLSTAAMAGAGFVPLAVLAAAVPPPRLRISIWAALSAFTGAWIVLRISADPSYEALESLRGAAAAYGTGALVAATTVRPMLRGERLHMIRPRLVDLVSVAVVGGVSLILLYSLHLSAVAVFVGVAVALVGLPATRYAGRRLERAVLADLRAQVAQEASEAERARLARELHDVPLQELTSVIRHLDSVPGAREGANRLRAVATQLRETATDLRPPVLDDLGLGAALDFLATQATDQGINVMANVTDGGPDLAARPPAEVELAIFRVAQEAVTNAVRHAEATSVQILGSVTHDAVSVTVHDDGRGLTKERQREAMKAGRLGLASMRRRAEAIDADLTVAGSTLGTDVTVRWRQ